MPTTVQNKTMKANISVKVGDDAVIDHTLSVANINEWNQRIMTVPTSEVTLVELSTAVAAGTLVTGNVKLIAVINKDDTNFIRLRVKEVATNRIATLGSITGGSSYTNGTYTNVSLTGGTGSGAKAAITVSGGAVTAVVLTERGEGYTASDTLSAAAANIGGTGSGFSVPAATVETVSNIVDHKIPAGGFHVLADPSISTTSANASFSAFRNIETISAQADTSAVDVEIFSASI